MTKQPSFASWVPVATMVGATAALSVWASIQLGSVLGAWVAAPWVMFLSWGLYFMAGAKVSRIPKYFIGLSGGIFFGVATLVISGYMSVYLGSAWGLPATVFLAATSIVLLELTNLFELAPAYFFAYAGYFAYVFGKFSGDSSIYNDALHFWILMLAGLALGFFSASIKTKILNIERVPFDQRNTVFDKE